MSCAGALLGVLSQSTVACVHGSPSPLAPLNWDDVRLFLALCRSRTVGEAGRLLSVDGSTVSRRLAALEELLATTLFERGRSGIVATEAAEELMPVAEQIEEAVARFTGAAETLEREVAGLVRLTCPPDAAEVLVAPLLPALLQRYPALRINLDAGEGVLDLTRREADIALRTARPDRGDLVVTRLATVRWVAAATPELVRELGTLRSWADLPWVGCGERYAHTSSARWFKKHVDGVEPVVRSDSLRVQIAIVATGGGVALVPEPSVEHFGLAPVKLSRALRDAARQWPEDELYLVTHRALRQVPRVRVVWEFLLEHAGERTVSRLAKR